MNKIVKTEEEWRKILTPEQYRVLRQGGTECAFTGSFWDEHRSGVYRCGACKEELFTSENKFESGTGWPSFYKPLVDGRVVARRDTSHGMVRTEVLCAACDSHLGHVFPDGPPPSGLRYCINSEALAFEPRE